MADYTQWRPVVNMDAVNQARRQRAVLGREPKVDDPSISDAYMVTRPTPNTRMDVPANTPNPVAVGIAKMQEPDPTNVPVSPEAVRRAQDGVSRLTGIQATPDVELNDARLQQDLQDKRAWTASAMDAPGTATVAGLPIGDIPPDFGNTTYAPPLNRPSIAQQLGAATGTAINSGEKVLRGAQLATTDAMEATAAAANDFSAGYQGQRPPNTNMVAAAPVTTLDSPAALSQKVQGPSVATSQGITTSTKTIPNYIVPVNPTDVQPRSFVGVAPTEAQIAQARRDAQLSDSNYTPLADRMASLNAGIAAMQDLGRAKANAADGLPLDTDRSKWGVKVIGDPSWDEAMKDYAAGRVGSPGYGMIRNLKMEQEAQQAHGRRGKAEATGLQIPSDPKAGRDASLQDALAMMQYDRGLRNDQQQVAQHNADNTLKLAGLQQQGDIAERTDARERATLDQRKAKEQGEQYDADAAVEIGALPQTLSWAAPIADRFYAAGKGKFRTAAEATQALGAVTRAYANNPEKGFKYKDGEEYSNADAVRIAQGTYDGWGNRVTGMKKEDREARQAAASEYLMHRALEVKRGS